MQKQKLQAYKAKQQINKMKNETKNISQFSSISSFSNGKIVSHKSNSSI